MVIFGFGADACPPPPLGCPLSPVGGCSSPPPGCCGCCGAVPDWALGQLFNLALSSSHFFLTSFLRSSLVLPFGGSLAFPPSASVASLILSCLAFCLAVPSELVSE